MHVDQPHSRRFPFAKWKLSLQTGRPVLVHLVGWVLLFCLLATQSGQAVSSQGTPDGAGEPSPTGETTAPATNQIIIKYREAGAGPAVFPASVDTARRLSSTAGTRITYFREMSGGAHVMRLPEKLPYEQVQAIAARLSDLPEVEYAEPDGIRRHTAIPNDPLYGSQWHYAPPSFSSYGINAPEAWAVTQGSPDVVVAVLDTGITPHADLAGRIVPGYDFISKPFVANDGDGRDNDPTDPGDWYAEGECSVIGSAKSSWHGTHVAGTIGAASNNGIGVTGVNWHSKILPVRVLGKCGGYDSDIADAMLWAAGLPVNGVPANPYPAKVLNLSLGGETPCGPTYQNAINAVTSAGATVVVAAGNSNKDASGFSPAGCSGVITVAATDRYGSKASYSNYGSVVDIAAPGGVGGATGGILSTLNSGEQGPAGDTYGYYQGTSMAAPHVSGVVSLLYSVKPSLTPSQVLQYLQLTATAFPAGSDCSPSVCGQGIVNARAVTANITLPDGKTKVFLPHVAKPVPPYTGQVTANGVPVAGVQLKMAYTVDNGTFWNLTYATATTDADGRFSFNPPPVGAGKAFAVYYDNPVHTASPYLWYFECRTVDSETDPYQCNLNIADVVKTAPANKAKTSPKVMFTWKVRPTATDSYWWSFYDLVEEELFTSEYAGYTGSKGIEFYNFPTNYAFGWSVDVETPDGYGIGHDIWVLYFNSTLSQSLSQRQVSAETLMLQMGARAQNPNRSALFNWLVSQGQQDIPPTP